MFYNYQQLARISAQENSKIFIAVTSQSCQSRFIRAFIPSIRFSVFCFVVSLFSEFDPRMTVIENTKYNIRKHFDCLRRCF